MTLDFGTALVKPPRAFSKYKRSAENGVAGARSAPATPFSASFLDFEKALLSLRRAIEISK
jgi:hypothetical protein